MANQEFLKAQEFKEKITNAEKEKESLMSLVESGDIESLKKFATPKHVLVQKVVESAVSRLVKISHRLGCIL